MERSCKPRGMNIIVAAVLAILPLAGCSVQTAKWGLSDPSPGENPRPSPPEVNPDRPATIGVVTAPFPSTVDYSSPARGGGAGAAIGAAKGLGLGMLTGAGCVATAGYGEGAALCILAMATPYFTVRYAVDQAKHGVPGDEMKRSQAALAAAVGDPNLPKVLRDQVLRSASLYTGPSFLLPFDPGPSPTAEGSSYGFLASQGIDTVLEVGVQRIALQVHSTSTPQSDLWSLSAAKLNPSLTLVVIARSRVIRVADGSELYASVHASDDHTRALTLTEWAANDAQALRGALDQFMRALATEAVEQMFDAVPAFGAVGACALGDPTSQNLLSPLDPQGPRPS